MTPAELQQRRAPSQARGHQRVRALLDATAVLLDNEPTLRLSVINPRIQEDQRNEAQFVISLNRPTPANGLVINYEIGGTAVPDEDYLSLPEFVRMLPGQQEARLAIAPIPDDIAEGDETVQLQLRRAPGYAIGATARGEVTILDEESGPVVEPPGTAPVPSLSSASASAGEAGGSTTLTVTLAPSPDAPVVVRYRVGGSATPGEDYVALPGSLVIDPSAGE